MNKKTEAAPDSWDMVTCGLHWISAIWVTGLLGLGLVMVNLVAASGPKFELYQLHKSWGFVFGIVLIARLVWKLFVQRPKALGAGVLHKAGVANQNVMLVMLLVLVVSGYALASFSIIPIPIQILGWNVPALLSSDMVMEQRATAVHHVIAFALIILVFAHSGAALFHHFVLKDRTLARMLKKSS